MLAEVNLPQLSLEERDRRYRLVREKMAARGLDCLVMPHNTVKIIARFSDFVDPDKPYMFHCHILEHEDAGMMGQFVVV